MRTFLHILVASAALTACGEAPPNVFPNALQPEAVRVEVDTVALDFGAPSWGESVEREIVIRSTGDATALVDVSMADAHGFGLDAGPRFLAPGESWTIPVTYEATGLGLSTDVTIRSNATRSPVRRLPVSVAESLPTLVLDPPTLDFGPSTKDVLRTVELSNHGEAPLVIQGIESVGEAFEIVEPPKLPVTLPSDGVLEVEVRFDPVAEGQVEEGYLRVIGNPCRGDDIVQLTGLAEAANGIVEEY